MFLQCQYALKEMFVRSSNIDKFCILLRHHDHFVERLARCVVEIYMNAQSFFYHSYFNHIMCTTECNTMRDWIISPVCMIYPVETTKTDFLENGHGYRQDEAMTANSDRLSSHLKHTETFTPSLVGLINQL